MSKPLVAAPGALRASHAARGPSRDADNSTAARRHLAPVLVTVRALALVRMGARYLPVGHLAAVPLRQAVHATRYGLVAPVEADALDVELGIALQDVIPRHAT